MQVAEFDPSFLLDFDIYFNDFDRVESGQCCRIPSMENSFQSNGCVIDYVINILGIYCVWASSWILQINRVAINSWHSLLGIIFGFIGIDHNFRGSIDIQSSDGVQIRLFITFLVPLVIGLGGLGAWAVCRDEFNRLLLYGGQAAVIPLKLSLEPKGWTSVEGKGVIIIPLFGEVSFEPLDSDKSQSIELCPCCACYPAEIDDDSDLQYEHRTMNSYPGLSINQTTSNFAQGNDSMQRVMTG